MRQPLRRHGVAGFYPAATWVFAALLSFMAAFTWLLPATGDRTGDLRYPAESAARLAERHLNFYAGIDDAPAWQRQFFSVLFGSPSDVKGEARRVYHDVLEYFAQHPEHATPWGLLNIRARLLILEAETGPWHEVESRLGMLGDAPDQTVIADALRFAYEPTPRDGAHSIPPYVVSGLRMLPVGWSLDRVRLHTAERINQAQRVSEVKTRLERRGATLRERALYFAAVVAGLVVLGGGVLMAWWYRGLPGPLARAQVLEDPWSLRDGFGVFVRAGLLGMAVFVGLGLLSTDVFDPSLLPLWSSLFASLPMLWLIHRYLLRPRGLGFAQGFGLTLGGMSWRRLGSVTAAILAIELLGSLTLTWGVAQLGYQPHWSEGLSERWIWGPWDKTVFSAVNMIIWAPVFEEIGFRGLVYTTLRSRWTPWVAALASALLFSALHLYSLLGFLVVLWSGLVWALAYERFRTLIPGMLAHAMVNVFAISTVLLFYR